MDRLHENCKNETVREENVTMVQQGLCQMKDPHKQTVFTVNKSQTQQGFYCL